MVLRFVGELIIKFLAAGNACIAFAACQVAMEGRR